MGKLYLSITWAIIITAALFPEFSRPRAEDSPGLTIVEADSTLSGLKDPLGISAGMRGGLYVADGMSGKVFKYAQGEDRVEFPVPERFNSIYPVDVVAESAPFVYVLDYSSGKVLRYDYRGAYLDVLISFDSFVPASISAGSGGSFILTDLENNSVMVLNPLLDIELEIEGYGWEKGFFNQPAGAAILRDGRLAVADTGNRRVQIFSSSGAFMSELASPDGDGFSSPRSICCDREGNIYVADPERGAVFIYSGSAEFSTMIDSYSGKKISPSAVTIDLEDRLYVADLASSSVLICRLVYPDNEP
ncbi:MAG: hypothetical protein GF417_10790 [Candidatus Latescibacteria bacterium]|nr:hypothetical protein [bacterium]MBD3424912.1 hypothetical protein [Candidatus Latescibacterota bacterium]